MKKENRELLLKDLCTRLPYGVFCNIGLNYPLPLQKIFVDKLDGILLDFYEDGRDYQVYLDEVKPYLRPMSSMTEEEVDEFTQFDVYGNGEYIMPNYETIDWFNAHHFDYRGLIEKGLAIEAPEGMYK